MMEYRGYRGVVVYDDEAGLLHGEVVDTRDVITFQGSSVSEVQQAFRDSVDEYLTICSERGRSPDRPYSGRIALRLPSQVHRAGPQHKTDSCCAGKSARNDTAKIIDLRPNRESDQVAKPDGDDS